MISNPFDDIDMSLLDEFDNPEDLHSYLVSKYWLDPARKIEDIINQQNNENIYTTWRVDEMWRRY